jgi:hypothetical protein
VSALRRTLALALLYASVHAHAADEVVVASPQPDSVAVTVYRDDLALITETRTVTLPAEPVTLSIDGVVDTLLAQSAVLDGAGRPLAESVFSFDRLTPAALLERSVGENVIVTRTNPRTGRATRERARIVAAKDGVVLEIEGGHEALHCSGLPEGLELEKVPSELVAKPRLSVRLAAGEPGRRTVKVSYLAHGFAWSSDYVAHLNDASDRIRLDGWATLTNRTASAFVQAQVQVVAGKLNLVDPEQRGSRGLFEPGRGEDGPSADALEGEARAEAEDAVAALRGCFATPLPEPHAQILADAAPRAYFAARAEGALEEIVVTASRVMSREELGDYQLYRMPLPTDLGARQTKQVAFLSKPSVRVERFYSFRVDRYDHVQDDLIETPNVVLSFVNTERAGLGEPLPSGRVRVFERYAGNEVFAGEAEMGDRPVGLPVELTIGRALNLTLETTSDYDLDRRILGQFTIVGQEHRVVNLKGVPVTMEIRHSTEGWKSLKIRRSSQRERDKYGDLAWRFSVPAGGVEVLRYELEATR